MNKESNISVLLTSALSLILGIVLIIATEELLVSINYILVCIFSITGIVQILTFILNKSYQENEYNSLILGIIFLWVALFIYVYYTMLIIILPIILSLYAFIIGVTLIIKYLNIQTILKEHHNSYIFLAILSFLIGIFLIFKPVLTVYTYFKITGVYMIFISITYFLEYLYRLKYHSRTSE